MEDEEERNEENFESKEKQFSKSSVKFLYEKKVKDIAISSDLGISQHEMDSLIAGLSQLFLYSSPNVVKVETIRETVLLNYKRKRGLLPMILYKVDEIFRSTMGMYVAELCSGNESSDSKKAKYRTKFHGKCYVLCQMFDNPEHCNALISEEEHEMRGFLTFLVPAFMAYNGKITLATLFNLLDKVGRQDLIMDEKAQLSDIYTYIVTGKTSKIKLNKNEETCTGISLSRASEYLIVATECGYLDLIAPLQLVKEEDIQKDHISVCEGSRLAAEFDTESFCAQLKKDVPDVYKLNLPRNANNDEGEDEEDNSNERNSRSRTVNNRDNESD